MYRDHSVAVVVPAYNEAGFVGDVLTSMPEYVDRVYAVDDCSTDGTWAEICRFATCDPIDDAAELVSDRIDTNETDHATSPTPSARSDGGDRTGVAPSANSGSRNATRDGTDPSRGPGADVSNQRSPAGPTIVPIRLEENRGVGAAITTGYRCARREGIDVTAVMAGDGQMDPDQLPRLIDPIVEGRAAYAKGNRLRGRAQRNSMSTFRFGGNVLLSLLTKIASGYWGMVDPQNGYTAISGEALEAIDLDSLYTEYGFANDLLVVLNAEGFAIADVAMPAVYGDERSHISYRTFVPRLSWLLWRRFLHRLGIRFVVQDFHPLVALYALGIGGLAVGIWSLVSSRVDRRPTRPSSPGPDAGTPTRDGDDGHTAADPETGHETRSIRWWLAGVWTLCSAIALCLAMAFDHDANEGSVVVEE
ncbi:glycosyl transferase [Halovivax ruber XH-70]|uniref:Glycosyl transferase n=1 Tax=Halovivax ruber (strain DSM 18193 / JCM 13892 / XH-70) TaxID=797302 RepID=L0I9A4_HALRX|nr:glycosyltransferase family 2 protein [Halovivax ruber]AGB16195.1 glycosyl transferase [Halovivax ruber XH-70]